MSHNCHVVQIDSIALDFQGGHARFLKKEEKGWTPGKKIFKLWEKAKKVRLREKVGCEEIPLVQNGSNSKKKSRSRVSKGEESSSAVRISSSVIEEIRAKAEKEAKAKYDEQLKMEKRAMAQKHLTEIQRNVKKKEMVLKQKHEIERRAEKAENKKLKEQMCHYKTAVNRTVNQVKFLKKENRELKRNLEVIQLREVKRANEDWGLKPKKEMEEDANENS